MIRRTCADNGPSGLRLPLCLGAGLAVSVAAAGCGELELALTAYERARLETLVLTGATPSPPSPTNQWADAPEAAALGQRFYFDTRFSGPLGVADDGANGGLGALGEPGRVACASCHNPQRGGTDHRSRLGGGDLGAASLGAGWTGRNAPSVMNLAFRTWMFWDGRKDSVWSQALGPVESPREHNLSRLEVVHRLRDLGYAAELERIVGSRRPGGSYSLAFLADTARFPRFAGDVDDPQNPWPTQVSATGAPSDRDLVDEAYAYFGKMLEAYERTLRSGDAPFDLYLTSGERRPAGDPLALSDAALRGAKLFVGKAACDECHSGPILSDEAFHNHGVSQSGAATASVDLGRAAGIPQVRADPFNGAGSHSDDADAGAAKLAALPAWDEAPAAACATTPECGAFKTPTLRDLTRTGPYMHTGGFTTLWDVIDWYRRAAGTDGAVGPRDRSSIAPLRLDDAEVDDLVAFLVALDGQPPDPALATCPPEVPEASCGCCTEVPP